MFVHKSYPVLSDGRDSLKVDEIYHGKYTPIVYRMEKNMKFSCQFGNIKLYPFGVQPCSFKFGLQGPGKKLTKLESNLNLSPLTKQKVIRNYMIKNWILDIETSHSNQNVVAVTMNLIR